MKVWINDMSEDTQASRIKQVLAAENHQVISSADGEWSADDIDAFHIFPGAGRSDFKELNYAASRGKVRVVQFYGPEIRTEETSALRNPYARLIVKFADPEQTDGHLRQLAKLCPACIVPDIESVEHVRNYFKRIYVMPYVMNTALEPSARSADSPQAPLIVHAPKSAFFAGTTYVREALERLTGWGYSFRYEIHQGLSDEERAALYREADLVIDQLLIGAYSAEAVDAMALGKPVFASINPIDSAYYMSPPIVRVNPATLTHVLANWLKQPGQFAQLGEQGIAYVHRVHNPGWIANRLQWIYQREADILSGASSDESGVVHNLYWAEELSLLRLPAEKPEPLPVAETEPLPPEPADVSPVLVHQGETTFRLYPNRILKRKQGTYVSFNLAEIPGEARIESAIMHIRFLRRSQSVPIYRIRRGWDRETALKKKRLPRIAKLRLVTLRLPVNKRSKKPVLRSSWECTALAKTWQYEQLNNHGVFVKKKLKGLPYLDVTVSI